MTNARLSSSDQLKPTTAAHRSRIRSVSNGRRGANLWPFGAASGREPGVAGAVTMATAVTITLALQPSGSAATGLSAAPLGVNVAPWDGLYTGSGAVAVQPKLEAAGIRQLRYGGGSYADIYNWQTNINVGACEPVRLERVRLHDAEPARLRRVLPAGPGDRRAEPGHGQLRLRHPRPGSGLGDRGRADGGRRTSRCGRSATRPTGAGRPMTSWPERRSTTGATSRRRTATRSTPPARKPPRARRRACGPSPPPTRSTRGSS